jgi:hypothetical protein
MSLRQSHIIQVNSLRNQHVENINKMQEFVKDEE